jgi:hypothetical protein
MTSRTTKIPALAVMAIIFSLCVPALAADKPPQTFTISGPETIVAGEAVLIQSITKNVSAHTIRLEEDGPVKIWGCPR